MAGRGVVAVISGASGHHPGMLALGLKVGDEVIVPPFTLAATADSVALWDAPPVFVEVDPEKFTSDAAAVDARTRTRNRIVTAVNKPPKEGA
ncbi:DegT/DnrJ/EryC1/StrS family aminotransferase [Brachybacterium sp. GCM10030268]|uniref:DegT/DnrJ/EryC1/StrS family aminotransferase n=1 Tax=Brachybacterium sp. GCM10030268 TaxID=3273382 RepID=UPI00361A44A0